MVVSRGRRRLLDGSTLGSLPLHLRIQRQGRCTTRIRCPSRKGRLDDSPGMKSAFSVMMHPMLAALAKYPQELHFNPSFTRRKNRGFA